MLKIVYPISKCLLSIYFQTSFLAQNPRFLLDKQGKTMYNRSGFRPPESFCL